MQHDRTAGTADVSGWVRGLGVRDALRLALEPVQRPLLAERLAGMTAAFEARLGPCEDAARSREDAALEALAKAHSDLYRARLMQDGLRASDARAPFAFVGPSAMVLELVKACLSGAVAELAARLGGESVEASPRSLERAAEAAAAWLRTFLDCRAVENFCFVPLVDPSRP
jgi:hypothetical protein